MFSFLCSVSTVRLSNERIPYVLLRVAVFFFYRRARKIDYSIVIVMFLDKFWLVFTWLAEPRTHFQVASYLKVHNFRAFFLLLFLMMSISPTRRSWRKTYSESSRTFTSSQASDVSKKRKEAHTSAQEKKKSFDVASTWRVVVRLRLFLCVALTRLVAYDMCHVALCFSSRLIDAFGQSSHARSRFMSLFSHTQASSSQH